MSENDDVQGDQGPEYDEALQLEEKDYPAVQVDVCGIVTTRDVPTVGVQTITRTIGEEESVKLVHEDMLRGRTTILSDGAYFLAGTKAEADAGIGHIPIDRTVVLHSGAELYIRGAHELTTYVTAICEYWAH